MKQKFYQMFKLVKKLTSPYPSAVSPHYISKKILLIGIGINNLILIGIDRHWALIEGVLILLLSSVRALPFSSFEPCFWDQKSLLKRAFFGKSIFSLQRYRFLSYHRKTPFILCYCGPFQSLKCPFFRKIFQPFCPVLETQMSSATLCCPMAGCTVPALPLVAVH